MGILYSIIMGMLCSQLCTLCSAFNLILRAVFVYFWCTTLSFVYCAVWGYQARTYTEGHKVNRFRSENGNVVRLRCGRCDDAAHEIFGRLSGDARRKIGYSALSIFIFVFAARSL